MDLWPLMTITRARKGLVYFSDPYLQHDHGLLVRAESPYQKPQDLAHARVARTTLPLDQQMVHRILPDAIAVSTPTQKEGIENVCQGLADAAFVEEFTGVTFLLDGATCPGQHLRLIWVEELQTKLAVGSTFAASGAADELRKGIAEFADDGGLPQLMARWGYYSPRNLENMVALLNAKRRERILIGAVVLLALLFGLCHFRDRPHPPPEEPNQKPASRGRPAGERRPVPWHGRHRAGHGLGIRPRAAVYVSQ